MEGDRLRVQWDGVYVEFERGKEGQTEYLGRGKGERDHYAEVKDVMLLGRKLRGQEDYEEKE